MDKNCCYCVKRLKGCFIKCADCPSENNTILCLKCFSYGAEAGQHKSTHRYHIINEDILSLLNNQWKLWEIELLLEAIDLYSYGNWKDISKHLGSKTAEDCQTFYNSYFVDGNIGKATINDKYFPANDHTGEILLDKEQPITELSIQDQQELGYMPLRDEFVQEYDVAMETDLNNIDISIEDEDEIDKNYKLFKLTSYREKLKNRFLRKQMCKKFKILQEATTSGSKMAAINRKKMSKSEKEFKEKMKIFGRLASSGSQHEKIIQDLIKGKRLEKKIKDLINYKKNGFTKLSDCKEFDNAKSLKEKKDDFNMSYYEDKNKNHPLLSQNELQLCDSLSISVPFYLTLKIHLLQDLHNPFPVSSSSSSSLNKNIEYLKEPKNKILYFINKNNWVFNTLNSD